MGLARLLTVVTALTVVTVAAFVVTRGVAEDQEGRLLAERADEVQALPSDLDVLPAGLTDVDTARISTAIAASRTESTRRLYALVWAQWERWCAARGIGALPADPLALCAYLTERAGAGRVSGRFDQRNVEPGRRIGFGKVLRRCLCT